MKLQILNDINRLAFNLYLYFYFFAPFTCALVSPVILKELIILSITAS